MLALEGQKWKEVSSEVCGEKTKKQKSQNSVVFFLLRINLTAWLLHRILWSVCRWDLRGSSMSVSMSKNICQMDIWSQYLPYRQFMLPWSWRSSRMVVTLIIWQCWETTFTVTGRRRWDSTISATVQKIVPTTKNHMVQISDVSKSRNLEL